MTEEPSLIERLNDPDNIVGLEEGTLDVLSLFQGAASELSRLEGEVERLTSANGRLSGLGRIVERERDEVLSALSAAETRAEKAEGELDRLTSFVRGDLQADLAEAGAKVAENLPWKVRATEAEARAQLAEGREKVLVEALGREIGAPLDGPTHGVWDRGFRAGLKHARRLLNGIARAALPHVQSKEGLGGASVAESGGTASPKSDGLHSDGGRG